MIRFLLAIALLLGCALALTACGAPQVMESEVAGPGVWRGYRVWENKWPNESVVCHEFDWKLQMLATRTAEIGRRIEVDSNVAWVECHAGAGKMYSFILETVDGFGGVRIATRPIARAPGAPDPFLERVQQQYR